MNITRCILYFLFFLLSSIQVASAQWQKINLRSNVEVFDNISDVFFSGIDTGYVATQSGVLYKTIDGGSFWSFDTINPGGSILRVFFPSNQVGYLTTEGGQTYPNGAILKTVNGGTSWVDVSNGAPFLQCFGLHFFNDDTGMVCAYSGYVFKTSNGGVSWDGFGLPDVTDVIDLNFISDSIGYVVGNCLLGGNPKGALLRTTDRGDSWDGSNCPQGLLWNGNYGILIDDSTFIGFYYASLKLSRGSINGTSIVNSFPSDSDLNNPDLYHLNALCRNIAFFEGRVGMVGFINAIALSTDSGYNWRLTEIDDTLDYVTLCGSTQITGFEPITEDKWVAFGKCGRLYLTENKGGVWSGIEEEKDELQINVFPNPANDYLNIACDSKEKWSVGITDVTGKILIEENASGNSHIVSVSQLPSGLYFAIVETGKGRVVKRWVKE